LYKTTRGSRLAHRGNPAPAVSVTIPVLPAFLDLRERIGILVVPFADWPVAESVASFHGLVEPVRRSPAGRPRTSCSLTTT